jgi:hypothetical protein
VRGAAGNWPVSTLKSMTLASAFLATLSAVRAILVINP